MDFQDFIAGEDDAGRRIDKIVRKLLPRHSLGMICKYFRKGLVRKNKGRTSPEARVNLGDAINIATFLLQNDFFANDRQTASMVSKSSGAISDSGKSQDFPTDSRSPLEPDLFINRHVRIINKPYGIPVQGGKNIALSLDKIIAREYLQLQQKNGLAPSLSFRPGPLHRLDRKTTGILAFSQSLPGARWFSQALRNHAVGKEYLALVEGILTQKQWWQEEIARPAETKTKGFIQSKISGQGKKADTRAIPLAWGTYGKTEITLLRLIISTGRTHQIRLHCSHHGFPLLGDTAYGGGKIHEKQDLFLHAWRMTLPSDNPLGLPHHLEAPLPENFKNMIHLHLPETDLTGYSVRVHEIL